MLPTNEMTNLCRTNSISTAMDDLRFGLIFDPRNEKKYITAARKSILKLVQLQSLVAEFSRTRKI